MLVNSLQARESSKCILALEANGLSLYSCPARLQQNFTLSSLFLLAVEEALSFSFCPPVCGLGQSKKLLVDPQIPLYLSL